MSADWQIEKLSKLASKITKGTTPTQKDGGFSSSGINFIKAESVGFDSRIDESKFSYINEDTHRKLKRSQLETNDILFSMAGVHLGKVGIVEEKHIPANTNQALALIRPIKEMIEPMYLFYYLQKREINHFVNNATSQSAQPNINLEQIGNLDIEFPSLEVQKRIVSVLHSLDRKIDTNTQTNQTLESIAQAIFKSWFVDFEPVKAKMAAKERWYAMQPTSESASPVCYADEAALPDLDTYTNLAAMCAISGLSTSGAVAGESELAQLQQQNPDQYQQLTETAALFPSAMVDSELGEIPEGWEVCKFQEIANIIMGQSPAGDTYNSKANGIALINGPVEFGEYYPERTKWTTLPTKLAVKGDLVVCVRGSTTGRFVKSDGQYCLGRGVCAIRGKRYQCFVDLCFKYNIEALLQLATGSTFPNWSSQTLSSFSITCPTDSLIIIFEEQIKALTAKLENGVVENHYLSQLRDSLLPKLLSGELSVSDKEIGGGC